MLTAAAITLFSALFAFLFGMRFAERTAQEQELRFLRETLSRVFSCDDQEAIIELAYVNRLIDLGQRIELHYEFYLEDRLPQHMRRG